MVTRLSGGLTPADGADPRTFPAIWNTTAGTIESQGSAVASQGSAIAVLEGDSLPTDVVSPVSGDSLVYDGTDWVNGPRSGNAVINGDFGVWQRGTSFGPSGTNEYSADRWFKAPSSSTMEVTRESFTPADIEAIGYGDAEYYLRMDITVGNNFAGILQKIEDVRTFAGQTVTLSFWARSDSTRTYRAVMTQSFGSGGSSGVNFAEDVEIGTSWQRYTVTKTLGSMSGKTIGDNSLLQIQIDSEAYADVFTLDVWGVQLEAGSVATPFRLAGGGSKAAELALCQRYYYSYDSANFTSFAFGTFIGTTTFRFMIPTPVQMQKFPSIFVTDLSGIVRGNGSSFTPSSISNAETSPFGVTAIANITGGFDSHAGTVADAELISLDAEL